MIKEKLLKYSFFQYMVTVKLAIKRTFQKFRLAEIKYDKKSFNDFQSLVSNTEYIYEKEIEFLPKFIKKGSTVLDIGANRGEYSYYLSKNVGENGKVLAFEPGKRAFTLLGKIKEYYKLENLNIFKIALSNKKGSETLIVPYFNRQSQLLSASPIKGRKEIIEANSLDDFASETNFERLDFIKCDTEGSEYLVFSGGLNTISKFNPVIQVEIADLHTVRFGHSSMDVLKLLEGIGYIPYYYKYDTKLLYKTERIELKADGHVWSKRTEDLSNNNYFFIHTSKVNDFDGLIAM